MVTRFTYVKRGFNTDRMCPNDARLTSSRSTASARTGGDVGVASSVAVNGPFWENKFALDELNFVNAKLHYLHVEKQRRHNFLHVLPVPNVLHQVIRHSFTYHTLEAFDSRQPYAVPQLNILVVPVAHRREFRDEEIVPPVVRWSIFFDIGELNELLKAMRH